MATDYFKFRGVIYQITGVSEETGNLRFKPVHPKLLAEINPDEITNLLDPEDFVLSFSRKMPG